jgi:hypothetical protein
LKAEIGHRPLDGSARDAETFTRNLPPDPERAIHLEVLGEDTLDLGLQRQIRFARAYSISRSARLAT